MTTSRQGPLAGAVGPIASTIGKPDGVWVAVKWMLRDDYDTQARLAAFDRPVLVAVAVRDGVVPARFGRALHAGLVAPMRVVVIEAADHNGWPGRCRLVACSAVRAGTRSPRRRS